MNLTAEAKLGERDGPAPCRPPALEVRLLPLTDRSDVQLLVLRAASRARLAVPGVRLGCVGVSPSASGAALG